MNNQTDSINLTTLTNMFRGWFYSSHVILYVGQAETDESIKKYLSIPAWSCVVTTRRDPGFSSVFKNADREVKDYFDLDKVSSSILNKKRIPVVRLLGIEGDENDSIELFSNPEEDQIENAKKTWSHIIDFMSMVNPLVITGFDSEKDWQILGNRYILNTTYKDATNGTMYFWGMNRPKDTKHQRPYDDLCTLIEKKEFNSYELPLCEIINNSKAMEDDFPDIEYSPHIENDNDIFFSNKSSKSIPNHELLRFKNFGMLLTQRLVNYIQPLGKDLQHKWFYNFLQYSASEGPQWYGYLPNSLYYVKRDYEEALYCLVKRALSGKGILDNESDELPIILAGDPGSSKSVVLGSLAYRIFTERNYPVVFIPNESFLNTNIETERSELDEAMRYLEKMVDSKILVIWDSSAYSSDVSRALNLSRYLQNRGRRFVMVGTSYSTSTTEKDKHYRFDPINNCFTRIANASLETAFKHNDCYFIKANRQMNQEEKDRFWKTIRTYSGISSTTIIALQEKLSNEDEVFNLYYYPISLLREDLENSLKNEQSKVYPYVQKELKLVLGRIAADKEQEKKMSPMYQALKRANVDLSLLFNCDSPVNETDPDSEERLNQFNLCVALFSQFKLVVPYSMALSILTEGEGASSHGLELFEIVSRDIPWLYYGETKDGDFAFRFRNPLEADIYLRNHDASGEKQFDLLRKIIRLFGENNLNNQFIDSNSSRNLQSLIRLYGPNTSYERLKKDTTMQKTIYSKLGILIDDIISLIEYYRVPDQDAGFASIIVTFSREYYGKKLWDSLYYSGISFTGNTTYDKWLDNSDAYNEDVYLDRIIHIRKAISIAINSYDQLESTLRSNTGENKYHIVGQMNVLTVEKALCSFNYQELIEEYSDYCSYNNIVNKVEQQQFPISYPVLYQNLWSVINDDPLNGYAYVAIFRIFIKAYEIETDERKRLQYMSEIMQIIDVCQNVGSEITSRGQDDRNEIDYLKNKIIEMQSGIQITLSDLIKHEDGETSEESDNELFWEMYDEMLANNNPSAIMFVCQRETPNMISGMDITDKDFDKFTAVYNFMLRDNIFKCIQSNSYAMCHFIKILWIIYNKSVLSGRIECQLTHLTNKQWQMIHDYCQIYYKLNSPTRQTIIILLYALSTVHINHFDQEGFQEAKNILDSIKEDTFYQQSRMKNPFMLCDESGNPYKYTGRIIKIDANQRTGIIAINEISLKAHFFIGNLGRNLTMPEKNSVLSDLEIGVSFLGFNAYKEEGRHLREERNI